MAYALHTLVTFGGTLSSGAPAADQDIWQCGIRVAADVGDGALVPVPNLDDYIGLVGPAIKAVYTGTGNQAGSDQRLDFVKVAQIDTTGKYVAGTSSRVYSTGLPVTGTTGRVGPPFLAMACSWTTALGRGAGHAGRIYLPYIGYSGFNTSRVLTANPPLYQTWAKAFLGACHQTSLGAVVWPVVASKKAGTLNKITGIRVGDVVDVQRRRKNKLRENYTATVAFP